MAQSKLAWQSLSADDNRLPEKLQKLLRQFNEIKEAIETVVAEEKPAPKGRKWVFTYKYGVAIAMADAGSSNNANYFA